MGSRTDKLANGAREIVLMNSVEKQTSFLVSELSIPDLSCFLKNNNLTDEGIKKFQETIYAYYKDHGRQFAWRSTQDPYCILVSEVMLQQTQTYRVEDKYKQFIKELPDIFALANASTATVLRLWQGLGYNRRAIYLQKTAQKIAQEHNGKLPQETSILQTLPGIGLATASSICAFAFNKPTVFIETNIRAVFIQLLFSQEREIHDNKLRILVEQTVDTKNPRHWYYALMDYGAMLKKICKNPSRKSVHHVKQTKFEGSNRQIRGAILKLLTQNSTIPQEHIIELLCSSLGCSRERVITILSTLCDEQLIHFDNNLYYI